MPVYQIGYGTCEESEFWEFEHDDVLTKDDLRQIVEDCLLEVMDMEAGKFGEGGFHKGLYVGDDGPTFQSLMGEPAFMCLLKDRGFRQIQYEESFSLFGWASAIKPGDWDSHTGDVTGDMQVSLKARTETAGIYVEKHSYKRQGGGKSEHYRLNRRHG